MISESDVCSMKSLKKSQVFVYDKFEGPAFQHILVAAKQNKAVLVQHFDKFFYIINQSIVIYNINPIMICCSKKNLFILVSITIFKFFNSEISLILYNFFLKIKNINYCD